jgi:hypothetical protein
MSKKLNQVWIVWARTGEWEDKQKSILAIFDAQDKAEKYLALKRQEFDALGLHEDGINNRVNDYDYRLEIDENTGINIDYTGVSFSMSKPYEVL